MPDRSGRFSAQDGLNIARTFIGIQDRNERREDRLERREDRRRDKARRLGIENNLKLYAQGKVPDRNAPDYDAVADIEAQTVWLGNALKDEQLTAVRRDNDLKAAQLRKPQIDQIYNETLNTYRQYESEQDPEKKKALGYQVIETALPMYDFVPNGTKFQGRDDKKGVLKFKNVMGQDEEEPIPDPKAVVQRAFQFAQNYGDYYHSGRESLRKFNVKQMLNHVREKAKDGTEALHFTMLDMDENGDFVPRETWKDPKTLEVIKGFDESTGKEVGSDLDFKPAKDRKAEADIAHTEATTRKLVKPSSGASAKSKSIKTAKDTLAYELQPFAGSKPVYDENDVLTKEGKTALDAAIHLVAKYRRKEELTDEEKAKIKHALKAVNMYEQDSDRFTSDYKSNSDGKSNSGGSNYVNDLIKKAMSGD